MTPPFTDQPATLRHDADALIAAVSDMLLASLKSLADAGQIDAACRFAGRACVLLRRSEPDIARRFDVLLHRLAPRLAWSAPPVVDNPNGKARRAARPPCRDLAVNADRTRR